MDECKHEWEWIVGSPFQRCAKCRAHCTFEGLRAAMAASEEREKDRIAELAALSDAAMDADLYCWGPNYDPIRAEACARTLRMLAQPDAARTKAAWLYLDDLRDKIRDELSAPPPASPAPSAEPKYPPKPAPAKTDYKSDAPWIIEGGEPSVPPTPTPHEHAWRLTTDAPPFEYCECGDMRAIPDTNGPLPPDVLADALQDRIHPASGKLIASAPLNALEANPPAVPPPEELTCCRCGLTKAEHTGDGSGGPAWVERCCLSFGQCTCCTRRALAEKAKK